MSNKIVPVIYRAIIDDVIANISVDFEEYGMDEDLLPLLQTKWEQKLLETRVADFARTGASGEESSRPAPQSNGPSSTNGSHAPPPTSQGSGEVQVKAEPEDVLRLRGGADDTAKPDAKPEPNAAGLLPGDEVIDSDLDDSDDEFANDEDGEEGEGEADIVFCVYDKVARVKNKWKTVFKDGMIHINGRDYLFTKCQGEFEW